MGTAERKARERGEVRGAILAAARRVLLAEGWDAVSIRRIAGEVEYSPGALYLYFEDKQALLAALQEEGFAELRRRQAAVDGVRDPVRRLLRHGEAYLAFALEHPETYDLMFVLPEGARLPGAEGAASYQLLRDHVAACVRAGRLAGEVEPLAHALFGLVHGLASLAIRSRRAPGGPVEDEARRARAALRAILTPITRGEAP
jgi:AcrR family transcriptional regulator